MLTGQVSSEYILKSQSSSVTSLLRERGWGQGQVNTSYDTCMSDVLLLCCTVRRGTQSHVTYCFHLLHS